MDNHLLVSWLYFSNSAMFSLILLIFAVIPVILTFKSEMDNMSQAFSDLTGRPRALFNFLINPGIFFPWTLVEKKTSSKTER